MYKQQWFAASTVLALVSIGAIGASFGACSANGGGADASIDSPPCNPDSGDTVGCSCDPSSYKTSDCYTGPPGTNAHGICKTGKRSCNSNGTLTACVGEVTPQPEVCNYADDDCDGIVDDLPEIVDAAVLAYCTSPACTQGTADAAITCWGPDLGICGAGTKACAPGPTGGTPTGCNEFIHGGVQEVCNGIDDDCNGAIDDGLNQGGSCDMDDGSTWPPDANPFDGGVPQAILGQCVHGQLTCVDYGCTDHGCADAGNACFPSQPNSETCDGKDNDCNGLIDDHACANAPVGDRFCCHYSTYYTCAPSTYTTYGYICADAG